MRNKVKSTSGGKIKIAIDISPTTDGNSVRGVGYYTQNLVTSLKKEIESNSKYKNWSIDLITNPKENNQKYDLIHYPYFDPFKLTLPPKKNTPTLVTVHDLIPRQFKNHFPVGIKGTIKWLIQKYQLKKTSGIITVSQYSKTIINKIANYPLDQISVTYEAADKSFRPIRDNQKLLAIQKKYHLPNKFILFVGDINWNKNIPHLVKACLKNKYPLVIVGSAAVKTNIPEHPWTEDLLWLQSKFKKLKQKKSKLLTFTGFVPDEDLPSIYNLATIYCQPSFAEGFGLPLLQAMQSGCPVAFSRDTCLSEIMNGAGLAFNPRSIAHIRETLKTFWKSVEIRQQYVKLGLARAKHFSWEITAKETLSVYKKTIGYEE